MLPSGTADRIRAIDVEAARLARNVLSSPTLRDVFRERARSLLDELTPIAERVNLFPETQTRFGAMVSESILDLQFVADEVPGMMSLRLARLKRNRSEDADTAPN